MDELAKRVGGYPAAGVLVALIVTLTMWQPNMNRLGYEHALPTIGFVLGATALLSCGILLLVRDRGAAGILSCLMAAFIFYSVPMSQTIAGANYVWIGVGLLLLVTVLLALRVPKGSRATLINGKLNLLVMPVALAITASAVWQQWRLEQVRPDSKATFGRFDGRAGPNSPDVWHILFDRYASRETLARRYAFDNGPFLDALRKRGFAVAEGKFSNYQRTGHSVSATLNGDSLDRLAASMQDQQADWVPIYRAIGDNRAAQFFGDQGYRTVFAGDWWSPTQQMRSDRTINYRAVPELGRKLLEQTPIGLAMRALHLPYGDDRSEQCKREKLKFAELEQLTSDGSPKYIFAHFLVPHPPFVLAADGRCRPIEDAQRSSRRDNYVAQVQFVNARVLRLIDAIAAAPRPAVIVIHSDEGPWPEPYVGNEHSFGGDPVSVEWTKVDRDRLGEKMGILLAVRGPSGPPKTMPDSPVQIYPAILREHFGGRRPLTPSHHEVFESDGRLYTFHDVEPTLGLAQAE
jgi:hypothetical protein